MGIGSLPAGRQGKRRRIEELLEPFNNIFNVA